MLDLMQAVEILGFLDGCLKLRESLPLLRVFKKTGVVGSAALMHVYLR